MEEELKWLANAPWPSIPEWAGFLYVHPSTISRKAVEWTEEGLIVVRNGGRLVRPRNRYLNGTGGLVRVYPQEEEHHLPAADYEHEHDPFHPEWEDHGHAGFFNGYPGSLDLWERLELIEMWYQVAPEVLQGDGAAWTHDGRPRRILSWRWLRNTKLIHAVATYEDDYRILFGHIGRSLTRSMLEYRWTNRFPDVHDILLKKLVMRSRGEAEERQRDKLIDPPDSDRDYNPVPSAYAISMPDIRGVELAREVLPRGAAYLYLVGSPPGQRIYLGRADPAPHDDVADAFETVHFGDRLPQDLCSSN